MRVRRPAYAGTFYEATPQSLKNQIEGCFKHELGPKALPKVNESELKQTVGLISPHAGYMFSGPVAAHGYYNLALDGKPELIVIFGPNHTGMGSALAIMKEGAWRTPLGEVEIDTAAADAIMQGANIIDVDDGAHLGEHSIEVQLPWLQYLYGSSFRFVPICFLMQDLQSSREVGKSVALAVRDRNALIIASTDMTHYEPQKVAEKKDRAVIEEATKLNEEKVYKTVEMAQVSMCGYGPVIAAITAAKELGAKNGSLLCYKTSGDIVGDYSAVVGYASIIFTR